ncbi:MAG: hypothetical protein ACLFSY_06260 [Desulfonatronovibrionaceae bacterium]
MDTRLQGDTFIAIGLGIPVSFAGAYLAKRRLDSLPQKILRIFMTVFLGLVG